MALGWFERTNKLKSRLLTQYGIKQTHSSDFQKYLHFKLINYFFSAGWCHWSEHVLGWWKHREDPNILFLKYEELHKVIIFSELHKLW